MRECKELANRVAQCCDTWQRMLGLSGQWWFGSSDRGYTHRGEVVSGAFCLPPMCKPCMASNVHNDPDGKDAHQCVYFRGFLGFRFFFSVNTRLLLYFGVIQALFDQS